MERLLLHAGVVSFVTAFLSIGFGCKGKTVADGQDDLTEGVSRRFNAGRTSAISGGTLKAPLRRKWKVTLPGDVLYPVVTQDAVLLAEQTQSESSVLHAFNPKTGEPLWPPVTVATGNSGSIPHVAYADGIAFVVVATSGPVAAVDVSSGRLLWSNNYEGIEVHGNPVATAKSLYFSTFFGIARVDAKTGAWKFEAVGQEEEIGNAFALGEGLLATSSPCGILNAWDSIKGGVAWGRYECLSTTVLDSAVMGDSFVLGGTMASGRSAISVQDLAGKETRAILAFEPPYAVHGDTVFSGSESLQTLESRDVTTGKVGWTNVDVGHIRGGPFLINGQVYSVTERGTIVVLDEASGQQVWVDHSERGDDFSTSFTKADLGSNGDLLVVQTADGFAAYETDPTPPVDDSSFVARCPANAAFWIEGARSHLDAKGVSLDDGSRFLEGEVSFPPAKVYVGRTSTQYGIGIDAGEGVNDTWFMRVDGKTAPVTVGTFQDANVRFPASGPTLNLSHGEVRCDETNARYEVTRIRRDSNDIIQELNLNFVIHCNREAAVTRGCVRFKR